MVLKQTFIVAGVNFVHRNASFLVLHMKSRTNNPARTMSDIIAVATAEFADKGLSGGRIDTIAEQTKTSKRMIYYYFGSKEGLYIAVLEDAYRRIRSIEASLHLEDIEPVEALKKLVSFSVDYHYSNPDFVRLIMNENIHYGEFLAQSKLIKTLNTPAIDSVKDVYKRGVASGVFREGIEPVDIHMNISSMSFYAVSNRYTFGKIFNVDLAKPKELERHRKSVVDTVLRYLSI
jgi:AcrR family transcriptional regulator